MSSQSKGDNGKENSEAKSGKRLHEVQAWSTAELDEASKDGNEANKDVEGSELSLSKLNEITVFQSSIVDNVRTRADRVKKRKGSMFVTPPSSTPRQKTRVKKQAFVDVDEAINSLGERGIDEFRGRADFIGHEKSSDEDRKLVMEFLGKDKLDVIVWEDEHMSLRGHALCTLLFREPVESEIINVYMRIMRQQSLLNGSEIFCMDTNVQREILEHLEKFGKRRKIQNTDYEAFISRLSSFTRSKLMELNEEIFRRCSISDSMMDLCKQKVKRRKQKFGDRRSQLKKPTVEECKFAIWMIPQIFAYAVNFPIQKFLQSQGKLLAMAWISALVLVLHVFFSWLLILKLGWGLVEEKRFQQLRS
ncbi:multidrug resistance pump [Dorcoceras hygrometricum]|uniref:Multidrug resistance pump n=1 Tax=Dorcoceras hygrometricum TaxID=472368 RepID=A0A2Z7CWF8_9LAMI|nr:multidrug resistance pump [Dorcoceras hygrometricum]